MDKNTYALIVVGGVMITYFIIQKVLPFLKKASMIAKKLSAPKVYLNKNSTLTTDQYKKIALGAIYSEQQGAFINSLTTGLGESSVKELLSNWWGIDDSHDANEKLIYLRDKGFRFYLPTVFEAFSSEGNKQVNIISSAFVDEDFDKALSQLTHLKETLEELKEDNIISQNGDIIKYGSNAWDFGRLVFLTRVCFDAGYISEKEAWAYIDAASILAKNSFNNWEDYARSYVIGRAMWGGSQSANQGIAGIAKYLLALPNSPWVQMPW